MKERKRRFGDRYDGRRLRSLIPMSYVSPYIMKTRVTSSNYIRDKFDIEKAEEYIRKKREEGLKGFGMMHVIIASYIRVVSQRPGINRFIAGQRIYARNSIDVMLVIKVDMSLDSPETAIKVRFSPDATAEDVYRELNKVIDDYRNNPESGFDDAAKALSHIPGLFLKFAVWLLNFLDYFGCLPKFLEKVSPFHGSFFLTSMGSLGIPPIYHHLYDFGNVPVFLSFGAAERKPELQEDGSVKVKRYIEYNVSTDERICDGYYFASALKMLKKIFKNPYCLDERPAEIVEDVD
ncbi:MAG: 2-oxo acid dehydrogenase subunit E2 [Clostridia bacterium]|nr:2-oxo acid dehydrogenase subunit E2 [Clostridia bacterium]